MYYLVHIHRRYKKRHKKQESSTPPATKNDIPLYENVSKKEILNELKSCQLIHHSFMYDIIKGS